MFFLQWDVLSGKSDILLLMVDTDEHSGTGVTFWQVVAGRIISGIGSSGMIILVSIIITG